jgi:hypothetical protein
MQIFECEIVGIAPYSQSRNYEVDALQGEGKNDYYRRTWHNHMHVNQQGCVYIPPNGFKNCLSEAAKFLSIGIPGRGKSTYTKHIESGVQIAKPIVLFDADGKPIRGKDVPCERLFLPSDGRRGSGKRIWKYYPMIAPPWSGIVQIIILDDTVLQTSRVTSLTILEDIIDGAGKYIGLGRFRPRQNGFYGRFDLKSFTQAKIAKAA